MAGEPSILVVDDDPILREIAAEMLRAHGYACAVAEDGAIAIAALADTPADLVVLDMIMPNKEGIETLREIKTRWPAIRVVMISAGTPTMTAQALLNMARALGADAVIEKPLFEASFIRVIGQVLGKSA